MAYKVQIAKLPTFENLDFFDQALTECLFNIDQSLALNHSSMAEEKNPVLQRLLNEDCHRHYLAQVLCQYIFLPAAIVQLLCLGGNKVKRWPYIYAEIQRNIAEELGSRTGGVPHYEILKNGLLAEIRLDITKSTPAPSTKLFLRCLEQALSNSTPSFALGIIYGLENSAVPELYIVAKLVNSFSLISGYCQSPLIKLPLNKTENEQTNDHSLNSFFRMHVLDFEVGHKVGLAVAINKQFLDSDIVLEEFQNGFEYVLDQMDDWWKELSLL
jgi:hypothetical protein